MPLHEGKFRGYILIIEDAVGVFNLWPLAQYQDALVEFAGKGSAIVCVRSGSDESELEQQWGAAWEVVQDAFSVAPVFELLDAGGRLNFRYQTSFEELSNYWKGDSPAWPDLLASRN